MDSTPVRLLVLAASAIVLFKRVRPTHKFSALNRN